MIFKKILVILVSILTFCHSFSWAQSNSASTDRLGVPAIVVKKSIEARVNEAVYWYSKVKEIKKEQVSPQVSSFLRAFFESLEQQGSEKVELSQAAVLASENEAENILKLYDALIQSSGTDDQARAAELNALAIAIKDPAGDVEEVALLRRYLERFHETIDAHYARMAAEELKAIPKNQNETVKVKVGEIFKHIGTYSIYGFCMVTAANILTDGFHKDPFFSRLDIIHIAVFTVASGPFSFFNQLFVQTFDRLNLSIQALRARLFRKKSNSASPLAKICSKLFN